MKSYDSNKYGKLAEELKDYVNGDLSKIKNLIFLKEKDFDQIEKCLEASNIKLTLTKKALTKVLNAYLSGKIKTNQLSEWGKFIFYKLRFSNSEKYEPEYDDEISEIVMRLEWIGDEIDGDFTKEDAKKAIAMLSSKTNEEPRRKQRGIPK